MSGSEIQNIFNSKKKKKKKKQGKRQIGIVGLWACELRAHMGSAQLNPNESVHAFKLLGLLVSLLTSNQTPVIFFPFG